MLNTANARPVFYLIFCNCAVERISSRDPPLIKIRVSLARAARRFFADCRVKTLAAQNDAKGFSLSLAAEQAYARVFEEFCKVTQLIKLKKKQSNIAIKKNTVARQGSA